MCVKLDFRISSILRTTHEHSPSNVIDQLDLIWYRLNVE